MFSGARLRRLREERGLTQVALARALDLSTSYVNQLENDQRPITVPVLLALTERFDLPSRYFSSDSYRPVGGRARPDVFTATAADGSVSPAHIEELVARMPEVGRDLVAVYRRLRDATEELEAYRSHATTGDVATGAAARCAVRGSAGTSSTTATTMSANSTTRPNRCSSTAR